MNSFKVFTLIWQSDMGWLNKGMEILRAFHIYTSNQARVTFWVLDRKIISFLKAMRVESGEMTCDRSEMEEIGSFSFPNNFRILDDVDNFKCQFSSWKYWCKRVQINRIKSTLMNCKEASWKHVSTCSYKRSKRINLAFILFYLCTHEGKRGGI